MKNSVIFYGTAWCPDCVRAKMVLEQNQINYQFIDINQDPQAIIEIEKINKGLRSVPTIIFPDKTILVEPSNQDLENKIRELI